jgi:hypothetical protein
VTHTFDIRFDQTAGLAALLDEPGNHFRWKGKGVLRVDAAGISVSAGRSLLSLLRHRARRIPAADIKEVYREGEALRLEFATPGTSRAVLPFWAKDHETATRIVSLLPTNRTIEMEGGRAGVARRRPRARRRTKILAWVLPGVIAGATTLIALRDDPAPALAEASPAIPAVVVEAPSIPPATAVDEDDAAWATEVGDLSAAEPDEAAGVSALSMSVSQRYRDSIRPLAAGSPEHAFARQQLALFDAEADAIATAFLADQRDWSSRAISREDFVARLEANEMAWWDVTFRILDDRQLQKYPRLAEFRRVLLTSARVSRLHLTLFAQGVRKRDPEQVALANQALARAGEFRALLRRIAPSG